MDAEADNRKGQEADSTTGREGGREGGREKEREVS